MLCYYPVILHDNEIYLLAKKRFGQNFLQDKGVLEKILRVIAPETQDSIVEIGPGRGALTLPLLASGCRLTAIEIDGDLIPELRTRCPQLTLHHADALTFNFGALPGPFRLVGNLPYNIATPLLFHVLQFGAHIQDIHVMLQREVVERICALPNHKIYGRLSVMLQYYTTVERCFLISPGAFYPVPKVDSAVLQLIPKKNRPLTFEQEKNLEIVVKSAFAQRRKTLRNTLKEIITPECWKNLKIDPSARAENLSVTDFIHLVKVRWPFTQ